ncbi:MAG: hypothetical protein A3F54_05315 [Candidatus Kerfeldbacteria bacterium RIFCSPHIGHO2_12_FULL_48_17]|uniref:Bacterial type II secretion system protein E domain-containing protein n=1 Tax=Candidatus Kerfeldbacteria bacterium RIFCSPHIGHO2_12_FULL_48_17 TaxID=1798542 RepID=A0A1G2B552_9BACT|nr:MAG: hypothetical protein A3F54_05315 [Candidatus Kerfeldbacteria bacterium RIFCSPHIGHO2_12_FULL_48_17]
MSKTITQDNPPFLASLFSALHNASFSRAEQINLEPEKEYILISVIKDGVSIPLQRQDKNLHKNISSYIRKAAGIEKSIKKERQTGWIGTNALFKKPVRVTTIPTFYGEKILLNPIHDYDPSLTLDTIGMQLGTQYTVRKHLKNLRGLILIIGEDPRALKDTFYAMAQNINNQHHNITMLEDVIDQNIAFANQIETAHINLSKSQMIEKLREQDTDVIFVENIHKRKTLEAATQAALEGHLVVGTLHAENVLDAIHKLKDMSLDDRVTSNVLELIIEQKTLPGVHPFAAEPKIMSRDDRKKLKRLIKPYELLNIIRKETGADIASLNDVAFYQESDWNILRLPVKPTYIFGLTEFDNTAKAIFATGTNGHELSKITARQPFVSISEDAFLKALQGLTTLETIFQTLDKKEKTS